MRRKAEKEQSWRNAIKLGSVLGNREDIKGALKCCTFKQ